MASIIQICKMALSHIGSDSTITAISPPDGSVEAGYCATFYPVARPEMIELGNWNFTLTRATLAEVSNDSETWAYAYALPSDCLAAKRILRPGYQLTVFTQDEGTYSPNDNDSADFAIEGSVLYSNEPEAVLVYARDVTDTTKFTPSFVLALSYLLAAYLAGPIIKGKDGMTIGDGMRQRANTMAQQSAAMAANASSSTTDFVPSSVSARR